MNLKSARFFAATMLMALAPISASADNASLSAAVVPAGTYAIDSSHAQASGRVDHLGFSVVTVNFNKMSGSISYDPAKPEASTLDISIDTSALTTGFAMRDEHIKGAPWFDVARFPGMRYTAQSLTPKDATHATVNGELTLHGVTKPVPLEIVLLGTGKGMAQDTRVGFTGHAVVKRSDFGMTTYLPAIGDTVEITVDAEFSRK